jgi:hypothetical protein
VWSAAHPSQNSRKNRPSITYLLKNNLRQAGSRLLPTSRWRPQSANLPAKRFLSQIPPLIILVSYDNNLMLAVQLKHPPFYTFIIILKLQRAIVKFFYQINSYLMEFSASPKRQKTM